MTEIAIEINIGLEEPVAQRNAMTRSGGGRIAPPIDEVSGGSRVATGQLSSLFGANSKLMLA